MQVLETNFFTKSNNALNSVVKNTSCSHGWLRLVVQLTFGAITVASFVIILHMAMQRPDPPVSRCFAHHCRVTCTGIWVDEHEEDVISTVMEIGLTCANIALTLQGTNFVNETMPTYWMSRMPTNIHVLNIIGGNLRHIPSSAFVGQFAENLRTLLLENIIISEWTSTTFVGLTHVRHFALIKCRFGSVARNALRAIDATIQSIAVTHSGQWDPHTITGNKYSENKIETVDFSFNNFGSIIKKDTFQNLKYCKSLYLNSCRITTIGVGAFDPLESIELLFLSNNNLLTVPDGLFHTLLKINHVRPRVHLQNNNWRCDCFQKDLIMLSENGLLPIEATCKGPPAMIGKSVNDLKKVCSNSTDNMQAGMDIVLLQDTKPVFSQGSLTSVEKPCFFGNEPLPNEVLNVVSPLPNFKCNITFSKNLNIKSLQSKPVFMDIAASDWIRPTMVLRQKNYSMIQVSSCVDGYGLLWHQSSCPNEVYCISIVPNFLRVYNSYPDTEYTFCPFDVQRLEIPMHNCVNYNFSTSTDTDKNIYYEYLRSPPFIFIIVSFVCLVIGAICVYMLIRRNPTLLKGSKRLLFVKHRNVDALVLPPKIPLRSTNSLMDSNVCLMNDKIFTLPDDDKLSVNHFMRSNSVRSDKSSTPTYVSAMQPTEAQLAEWRIRHHFDKSSSIISISSDISTFSLTSDCTSAEITTNIVYESLREQ